MESTVAVVRADPNPVPAGLGLGRTRISWEGGGSSAQLYASENGGEEVFFAEGESGDTEAAWIRSGVRYTVNLYRGGNREQPAASIEIYRETASREETVRALQEWLQTNPGIAAETMADLLRPMIESAAYVDLFHRWERSGIHITPNHFYQPIPDAAALPPETWIRTSALPGVDMRDAEQIALLREMVPRFRDEVMQYPESHNGRLGEFFFGNKLFDYVDAAVLHSCVRHFRPRLMIEIGSGYSTLVSAAAALKNGCTRFIAIEPFPAPFLTKRVPGLDELVVRKVEDVDPSIFQQLQSGDILFVDTSHVVKIGGDVTKIFLEIIPQLSPGVIVHVHDIFFPREYRREWVVDDLRFWSEQYLLQAFLAFNAEFEVLLCNSYLAHKFPAEFGSLFPTFPWQESGSFWMRRKSRS